MRLTIEIIAVGALLLTACGSSSGTTSGSSSARIVEPSYSLSQVGAVSNDLRALPPFNSSGTDFPISDGAVLELAHAVCEAHAHGGEDAARAELATKASDDDVSLGAYADKAYDVILRDQDC